jgi:hypothetical protein
MTGSMRQRHLSHINTALMNGTHTDINKEFNQAHREIIMNAKWIVVLAALCISPVHADQSGKHAGTEHPAEAVKGKKPANVGNKPALPPGVKPDYRKIHAGQEHPAIEAHEHPLPTAVENKPALPPGATTATHKVHAGQEHPVIEAHEHPLPTAVENKPALPPGATTATHKVHAGQEHPAIETHDLPPPAATTVKPALPPGVVKP